jgi:hypothetical protein
MEIEKQLVIVGQPPDIPDNESVRRWFVSMGAKGHRAVSRYNLEISNSHYATYVALIIEKGFVQGIINEFDQKVFSISSAGMAKLALWLKKIMQYQTAQGAIIDHDGHFESSDIAHILDPCCYSRGNEQYKIEIKLRVRGLDNANSKVQIMFDEEGIDWKATEAQKGFRTWSARFLRIEDAMEYLRTRQRDIEKRLRKIPINLSGINPYKKLCRKFVLVKGQGFTIISREDAMDPAHKAVGFIVYTGRGWASSHSGYIVVGKDEIYTAQFGNQGAYIREGTSGDLGPRVDCPFLVSRIRRVFKKGVK